MKILILLFALALPLSATSYPSGDPTVKPALPANDSWAPGTAMSTEPLELVRGPDGVAALISVCYLPPIPNCTTPGWCPLCADYLSHPTITLSEWCARLDLLPMPQPTQPGDQRPVCDPAWR